MVLHVARERSPLIVGGCPNASFRAQGWAEVVYPPPSCSPSLRGSPESLPANGPGQPLRQTNNSRPQIRAPPGRGSFPRAGAPKRPRKPARQGTCDARRPRLFLCAHSVIAWHGLPSPAAHLNDSPHFSLHLGTGHVPAPVTSSRKPTTIECTVSPPPCPRPHDCVPARRDRAPPPTLCCWLRQMQGECTPSEPRPHNDCGCPPPPLPSP